MTGTKKTITFSPFTRVEGDLHISLEISDGVVTEARATGTLFRGFEMLLRGREPTDALVITPRICGQCGVAHSAAAAGALADLARLQPPPNGILCRNVITAAEAVLNNFTHFYLSFAADLAHPVYGEEMRRRFAPVEGTSFRRAVRARKGFLAILGLFAGKWPNTLAIQPGGVTKTLTTSELHRARGVLAEFREFVEGHFLGGPLEEFLELSSASAVEEWMGRHPDSDLGCFVQAALANGLDRLGRGPGRFLAAGGYPLPDGEHLFPAGYYDGTLHPFDASEVVEHARFSWLEADGAGRHPLEGTTHPAPEKSDAYTWAKAPRHRGRSAEVGPFARALVAGLPLAHDLLDRHGPTVYPRMLLRLRETVFLVREIEDWIGSIDPAEPFCNPTPELEKGVGVGLTAAPRGMLGHWMRLEEGRILNYQVVTPTGWNLSPRDSTGAPGPVEEALVGTPVPDPADALGVAHVVRSFDPCLFCTVH